MSSRTKNKNRNVQSSLLNVRLTKKKKKGKKAKKRSRTYLPSWSAPANPMTMKKAGLTFEEHRKLEEKRSAFIFGPLADKLIPGQLYQADTYTHCYYMFLGKEKSKRTEDSDYFFLGPGERRLKVLGASAKQVIKSNRLRGPMTAERQEQSALKLKKEQESRLKTQSTSTS
jgi:hypothetical protein